MFERLIPNLLQDAAAKHQDRVALRFNQQSLTYGRLLQGAELVEEALLELNANPRDCIGLYMEKSPKAIQSMYGILLAGATYVPMDVNNPAARLEYIVRHSGLYTFITSGVYLDQLIEHLSHWNIDARIIVVSDTSITIVSDKFEIKVVNLAHQFTASRGFRVTGIRGDDVAAILYTSGSTGNPKGAMITHTNVIVFCQWVVQYFDLSCRDRVVSHAPLHFDLSLLDIFATLTAGACVVLVPPSMAGNPKRLSRIIAEEKITIWQSVPSVLVMLLKYGELESHRYPELRHVLFAGEVMRPANLKKLSRHFRESMFHNIYGCTETNDSFIYSMEAYLDIYPDPLPIGKPLPYVEFQIERTEQNESEEFVSGELYIKSPTTMRGYLQSSEGRDDHKNRMNDVPSEYYKTGDIVRQLADGNLLFCGRVDDNIKTSGYRVNILDVERLLNEHPGISEVAVVTVPDEEIGHRLLAVVKEVEGAGLTSVALKVYCAERIPRYAIPHQFEVSSQPVPRTPSGKVNKQSILKSRSRHVS